MSAYVLLYTLGEDIDMKLVVSGSMLLIMYHSIVRQTQSVGLARLQNGMRSWVKTLATSFSQHLTKVLMILS